MPRILKGDRSKIKLKRQLRSQMTLAEVRLWSRLRAKQIYGLKFRRQHGFGPYIVDFYCPTKALVIEIDGDSHADHRRGMSDLEREAYLASLGLRVLRYNNDDIFNNLDGVLQHLTIQLSSPAP